MCVPICTGGTAALTGSKKGLKSKFLEVSSNIIFDHYMIHREALVSKKLQPDFNKVLLNAISVISFINQSHLIPEFLLFFAMKWVLTMKNCFFILK